MTDLDSDLDLDPDPDLDWIDKEQFEEEQLGGKRFSKKILILGNRIVEGERNRLLHRFTEEMEDGKIVPRSINHYLYKLHHLRNLVLADLPESERTWLDRSVLQFFKTHVKETMRTLKKMDNVFSQRAYLIALVGILGRYMSTTAAYRDFKNVLDEEPGDVARKLRCDLRFDQMLSIVEKKAPDDLIINLYINRSGSLPPRRIADYQYMIVIDSVREEKKGTERVNYYIRNRREFVFNRYKTRKYHGQQRLTVDNLLAEKIESHISSLGLISGDFLFHPWSNKKQPYKNFADIADRKLTNLFSSECTQKGMEKVSINDVRRAFVSYFCPKSGMKVARSRFKTMMGKELDCEDVAERMGHKFRTQKAYVFDALKG